MNYILFQHDYFVGDLEGNTNKIISEIQKRQDGKSTDILIFSELSVSGYPPLDLLDKNKFIDDQLMCVNRIIQSTENNPCLVIFGYIERNQGQGRDLFNSVMVCRKGKKLYNYRKRLLPTYDVFDEARYFQPGKDIGIFCFKGKRIGLLICEDLWFENKIYDINPAQELFNAKADVIISINASPSIVGKHTQRSGMVSSISKTYNIPIVYCNSTGGNDDIVFDGNSFVTNERGVIIAHAKKFQEDVISLPVDATGRHAPDYHNGIEWEPFKSDAEFFVEQAVCGIRSYVYKCGFKGVVIGESGGIDSAVVSALAKMALGPDQVYGITMPSQYSSEGSYKDSEILCSNLGMHFYTYPIRSVFEEMLGQFNEVFPEMKPGLMEENLQARLRGQTLMSFSNRYGCLVLSTGNKSELSVGYCVADDSCIRSSMGLLYAHELFDSFNGNEVFYKSNKITHTFQSYKKDKYTIVTEIGNELSTSKDHEYKIYDPIKKKTLFKEAKDVVVGDLIVMGIGSNEWGSKTTLPPFKYVKKPWDHKSFNFKPPKEIDENLAIFLGVCVADGSYCGPYRIRSSKQYVASICLEVLEQLGLPDSCYKQTDKDEEGNFFIEISSVQFVAWIQFIGVKHGALNKDVPRIIRESPDYIVKAFLGGLLMDSSANNSKDRAEVTYRSSSRKLAQEVHYLFLNAGILCYLRGHNPNSNNPGYEIYIPPYETYKLSTFPILKETVKKRISSNALPSKNKSVLDYVYGIEEELIGLMGMIPDKKRATIRRALKQSIVKIGRRTLWTYLEMLPEDHYIKIALLKKISSDEYYVPCKGIRVEEGNFTMYDFTVDNVPEFNANGIEVHNCTVGGDMMGGLAPISDCYKMEVYAMASYINESNGKELIPQVIIDKAPSAELAPNQKDTDSLPPYPVLDAILKILIEGEVLPPQEYMAYKKIFDLNPESVSRVKGLMRRAEFKRRLAPITIKMHRKAFGYGRRIPIAQKWEG